MRTIKFRAWDKVSKKYRGLGNLQDRFSIRNDGFVNDDYVLEQFTGLHDKNGKEIYIGDIIEFVDKWEWYRGEWAPKFFFASPEKHKKLEKEFEKLPTEKRVVGFDIKEGVNFSVYDLEQGRWEVIGNIHQNPDLL